MDEYEELLNRVYSKLPEKVLRRERFNVPKVRRSYEGNKTVIHNFKEIIDKLNRDQQHIYKYLVKNLGTAGVIQGSKLVLHGVFSTEEIEEVIEEYVKDYVICPECKSPDTHIEKEGRISYLQCDACGARHSLR
jgi:translation initiation factor 2 subunit 2